MFKFLDFLRRDRTPECGELEYSVFHRKYSSFRQLLLSNNHALEIIADLENTIYQDKPFTYMHAVSLTESLSVEVNSIVREPRSSQGPDSSLRSAGRRYFTALPGAAARHEA